MAPDVRFGSKADMARSNCDVRFTPNSGHPSTQSKCLLWAISGPMHCNKRVAEAFAFYPSKRSSGRSDYREVGHRPQY